MHSPTLGKPGFGKPPEAFNSINMTLSGRKLIPAMIYSKVFGIAYIYKSVIAPPAIRMNNAVYGYFSSYNGLQGFFEASATISVYTFPWRLYKPNTIVFPYAPLPLFPFTRRAPKNDSSTST